MSVFDFGIFLYHKIFSWGAIIYASSLEASPLQFPFLLPQKLYGCRMNTERIKSPTQIIFRFTSFQQAHSTRSAHIFNSELTFTPPNCSHIHHRNRYFINCRCDNDVPFGVTIISHSETMPTAHFIHIINAGWKNTFQLLLPLQVTSKKGPSPAPRMHEPETQHYEVKTRYNYFSNIQNDLKLRTKSSWFRDCIGININIYI